MLQQGKMKIREMREMKSSLASRLAVQKEEVRECSRQLKELTEKESRLQAKCAGAMLKLGETYAKSGDSKSALLTYMNIYNQHKGEILYSAPACKAMMEIMWKRNEPASGDRLAGDFRHSDRWTAWRMGWGYVTFVSKSGIEAKLAPAERDEFNKVKADLATYAADASVQKEDQEDKAIWRRLQSGAGVP